MSNNNNNYRKTISEDSNDSTGGHDNIIINNNNDEKSGEGHNLPRSISMPYNMLSQHSNDSEQGITTTEQLYDISSSSLKLNLLSPSSSITSSNSLFLSNSKLLNIFYQIMHDLLDQSACTPLFIINHTKEMLKVDLRTLVNQISDEAQLKAVVLEDYLRQLDEYYSKNIKIEEIDDDNNNNDNEIINNDDDNNNNDDDDGGGDDEKVFIDEHEAGTLNNSFLVCTSCMQQEEIDQKSNIIHPATKLYTSNCGHRYCASCLEELVASEIRGLEEHNSTNGIICLNDRCDTQLSLNFLLKIIPQESFLAYVQAAVTDFLAQNSVVINCPNPVCSSALIINVSSGLCTKCDNCDQEFCASCKTIPFHSDFPSCKAYAKFSRTRDCRFCGSDSLIDNNINIKPAFRNVCNNDECIEKRDRCCDVILPCGCPCNGIYSEINHLPCLSCELNIADDICSICWVEELSRDVCIKSENCRHIFHLNCVRRQIESRWPTARISFRFLECPLCHNSLKHPALNDVLAPILQLKSQVKDKALERLYYEKLQNHPDIANRFNNNIGKFAMDHFSFYMCNKCKKPYFGGARACDVELGMGQFKVEELICGACQPSAVKDCPQHGREWIIYKCRFCCSVATFHCWGNTHFCSRCHTPGNWRTLVTPRTGENKRDLDHYPQCNGIQKAIENILTDPSLAGLEQSDTRKRKIAAIINNEPEKCPLGISHPPNGLEFGLGCGLCSNVAVLQRPSIITPAEPARRFLRPQKYTPSVVGVLRWGFPVPGISPQKRKKAIGLRGLHNHQSNLTIPGVLRWGFPDNSDEAIKRRKEIARTQSLDNPKPRNKRVRDPNYQLVPNPVIGILKWGWPPTFNPSTLDSTP